MRVIDDIPHAFAYTRWLLKALDQADVILTDRLHVGISGALLGKEENGVLRIKVCGLRVCKKRLGPPPVGKAGTSSL